MSSLIVNLSNHDSMFPINELKTKQGMEERILRLAKKRCCFGKTSKISKYGDELGKRQLDV